MFECDWKCTPQAKEPRCWVHTPESRPADYAFADTVDALRTF